MVEWLNSLILTFSRQPTGKAFLGPPRVRHGVVADMFGDEHHGRKREYPLGMG
jgi:hypothetical protein